MTGKIRKAVVIATLSTLASSVLAKTLLFSILCAVFIAGQGYPILLILPLALYIWNWRSIIFEVFLLLHIIEQNIGAWEWYSKIESNLYLGAIPMNALNHLSVLTMDNKVDAVLSVMESYELLSSTIVGSPVSPDQWKKEDVTHKQLFCYDFYPPSLKVLHDGADWINAQLQENHVVYCHCKSGKGRSASIVAAYYVKYRGKSAAQSVSLIRSLRPVVFGPNSLQMKNILHFEESLRRDHSLGVEP